VAVIVLLHHLLNILPASSTGYMKLSRPPAGATGPIDGLQCPFSMLAMHLYRLIEGKRLEHPKYTFQL
jgi:hypothetical protein